MGSEIESMDAFVELVPGIRISPWEISEFVLRGSIIDIYPLDQEYPLRLDFFDTEGLDHV